MINISREYPNLNSSNYIHQNICEIMQYLKKMSPVLLSNLSYTTMYTPQTRKQIIVINVTEEYYDLFKSLADCI